MKEAEAFVGKADDEMGRAEVIDFGDGGDAVEEYLGCGRGFGGLALDADIEAFAEEVMEADEALVEALESGLETSEAEVGVEHGEGAGKLVGIGEDAGGAIAIRNPDFKAGSKAGGKGIARAAGGARFFGSGRTGGDGIGLFRGIGEIDGQDGGDADAITEVNVVVSGNFGDMIAAENCGAGLLEKRTQARSRLRTRLGRNFQFQTGHQFPRLWLTAKYTQSDCWDSWIFAERKRSQCMAMTETAADGAADADPRAGTRRVAV